MQKPPTPKIKATEERHQGHSLPEPPEPPKWHELTDVNPRQEWRPVFRRDKSMYLGWVSWVFDNMADLYEYRAWDARVCAELRVRGLEGDRYWRLEHMR
ncbi:hypothetical protein PG994_010024 [Apiospora phragmitis]|uniref:Uncharacterized protein n=1 Tax=Apiospora phragmitis TaxID=2905665 RepID=A0ABR1TNV9_9PEZI